MKTRSMLFLLALCTVALVAASRIKWHGLTRRVELLEQGSAYHAWTTGGPDVQIETTNNAFLVQIEGNGESIVAVDSDWNLFVCGNFLGRINTNGCKFFFAR